MLTLEELFPEAGLKKSEDVYTALWDAVEFAPTTVLINYNTVNKQVGPLMVRLKKIVLDAQVIVFYSMDLIEYEEELKNKLLEEPGFENVYIMRIEELLSNVKTVISKQTSIDTQVSNKKYRE